MSPVLLPFRTALCFAGVSLASMLLTAPARADDPPTVNITVTEKGCEPMNLSVAAGKTLFLIKNASKRAIEWEILQGYMVVEERENIIPGFVQKLTATLEAGDYGMTCGLLNNPKGSLKVTAKTGALLRPVLPRLAMAGN
jgi:iron uptake system component EfeO